MAVKINLVARSVILSVVNVLLIILTVLMLSRFSGVASEIKELRNKSIASQETSDIAVIKAEIAGSRSKIDGLISAFPDESGLISFVSEIDRLKNEGVVTGFDFLKNEVTIDKTNNFGFPLLIKFEADPGKVDEALRRVQALPFLLRPVDVKIDYSKEENRLNLEYGGFLYVRKAKD